MPILVESLVIFLCIRASVCDGAVNYCGAKMCAHTDAHTFCRYPPGPDASCVGYIEAQLSEEDKLGVLARLNRRRSEVARGVGGLPPAADMLRLRWVEELAREAQRWADQCQPPATPEYHDGCRDLYSITVGQCVASVVGEAPGLRAETMVDVWLMQSRIYKRNVTNYAPPENANRFYGDFAQMFWSRAYMVGCGRSRFMTPWHGRLRSVERMVCNFAPRGPSPQRPIWLPGSPASACPARSRPDTDIPALCSYHPTMAETYDEDNTMSLEEHLLLNTIMEVERNASLDYIGSIDEIYLTKLAVATIEEPILTLPSYTINSVQKRNIIEKLDTEQNILDSVNNTDLEIQDSSITESNFKLNVQKKILKRKVYFVGRPKTYGVDDLNDSNLIKINNSDNVQETTTVERDIYNDYDFVELQDTSTISTTTSTNIQDKILTESLLSEKDEIYSNIPKAPTETLSPTKFSSNTFLNMSTESFEMFLDEMTSNLSMPQIVNEPDTDANVLDDYLSDPETVRQLQEALERMEKKIAATVSSSSPGKVRRELRKLKHGNEKSLQYDDQKRYQNLIDGTRVEDPSEIERNKTRDRGPMLNMVLKYMPYLKPYEKSIIGDSNVYSGSVVISPSFILFKALYF